MIGRLVAYNRLGLDVDVTLLGLGDIGAALLTQLTYLQRALDQTSGRRLSVTAVDARRITARELDSAHLPAHLLGRPLAAVLVSRVNLACGLNWQGQARMYERSSAQSSTFTPKRLHVVISALDSAAKRLEVARLLRHSTKLPAELWLDLGHDGLQGQAVLGWAEPIRTARADDAQDRPLPTISELLGETLEALASAEAAQADTSENGPATDTPHTAGRLDESCSDLLAVLGARLLWSALQPEAMTHHAYFVDLAQGAVNSQRVPPRPPPPPAKPAKRTRKKAGSAALPVNPRRLPAAPGPAGRP